MNAKKVRGKSEDKIIQRCFRYVYTMIRICEPTCGFDQTGRQLAAALLLCNLRDSGTSAQIAQSSLAPGLATFDTVFTIIVCFVLVRV